MKVSEKRATWLVLTLLVSLALGAQALEPSPEMELQGIAARLASVDRFDADIRVEIFGGNDTATPENVLRARVKRFNDREVKTFEHLTLLFFPGTLILVDHSRKEIHVRSDVARTEVRIQGPTETLSALRAQSSSVEASSTPSGRHFVFRGAQGIEAELFVDPATGNIRRVIYPGGADQPGRVVLEYEWKDPASLRPEMFDEAQFIVRMEGVLLPAPGLNGYRVVLAPDLR